MNNIIALAGLVGNLSILGFAVATISPALGMAIVVAKAMESTARQPEVGNRIQLFMLAWHLLRFWACSDSLPTLWESEPNETTRSSTNIKVLRE